ncbi:hypothetical protein AUC47_05790 [Microbacterium sp. SZ1]|uniref:hypothetical protein n=1 Tax=Microbacterium sp. SZ1 TaxID=1849736 RepID=UPI000BBCF1C9|nr:hypothetical protein [Microbacterium sp. SZ1]PCE14147.1 hypothetical protein AUC47_05790 [Microbacterium sp. SZ1]
MTAPIGTAVTPRGGHELPAHILGHSPRRAPRKRHPGLWVGLAVGVVAVGTIAALQTTANLGYDDAEANFQSARDSAQVSVSNLQQTTDALTATSEVANQLLQGDSGILTDPAAKESLGAAVAEADELASSASEQALISLPDADPKPTLFWELFGEASRLDEEADDLDELVGELDAEVPALTDADTAVEKAGLGFLGSAATAAAAFEAAHISAKNLDVIALRDAASDVSATASLDDLTVTSFVALQDAAAQVVASEQAELAEKAGPLQGTRLEIEAFARSLAPGVLLEFDWNPIVNNAGDNGSMGGLTTWWWDEPDRAVIELSNSVAEQWPADRSKALVAHEVGHAISVKCEDMYDSSTQDSIEKWATAWAIGMGFTDDANGVWAYGYPPQSYIDASLGCR